MNYPIYLDNNATTPMDPRVLERMLPVLKEHYGNPASASHEFGWYAAELVQVAREELAQAIGAAADEIVFTSGATESINLTLQGIVQQERKKIQGRRPHIISAASEHRAVFDTLHILGTSQDIELTLLPLDPEGNITSSDLASAIRPNTVLCSLMLANNEIGTIHPIAECSRILSARGVLLHCDATQALGKLSVDVGTLGADFLSISAHKIHGPKGVGALYLKKASTVGKLSPLVHGGGHESGLRSGTLNVPGIVGFGAAAALAQAEVSETGTRLLRLSERFLNRLGQSGARFLLNGPDLASRLPGNLNLYFPGVSSAKLLPALQGKVACSASSACSSHSGLSSHVLASLKFSEERIGASIRLGIGRMNSEAEIDRASAAFISAIAGIQN